MYRKCVSVLAVVAAVAVFALTPETASAQRWRGGGSGWRGGNWSGAGWYGDGYGRGWGGTGVGIGFGSPYSGYGWGNSPYSGYGWGSYPAYGSRWGNYPAYGFSSSPYYSSDSGAYYNTFPPYADSGEFYYGSPGFSNDMTAPSYAYGARSQAAADNEARLRVIVPADAKVWFDGHETKQTGSVRFFESPALTPGHEYSYDVKAQWRDQNGKEVTRTRHVDVRPNERTTVDFRNTEQ